MLAISCLGEGSLAARAFSPLLNSLPHLSAICCTFKLSKIAAEINLIFSQNIIFLIDLENHHKGIHTNQNHGYWQGNKE